MLNFKNYTNVTNIYIPNSVNIDPDLTSRFSGMTNLINCTIPMNNVTSMYNAYNGCTNLTTAVCGDNVINMAYAYNGCQNLTTAVCGDNVTNMAYAYKNCRNIQGNTYFYSNNISNVKSCFYNRNTSNMLNIYVPSGSTTLTRCLYTNTYSLVGAAITWTNDTANNRYYNATRNIYIYPVDNVAAAREANGD